MENQNLELVADIVSAHVSNNPPPVAQLPELVAAVNSSLAAISTAANAAVPEAALVPAVSIKKSVTADYLICLDDGKKFKSLRRHLGQLGMTPEEYRAKWNLPVGYPMVAPAYAAKRSALAKSMGLGRKAGVPNKTKKKAA